MSYKAKDQFATFEFSVLDMSPLAKLQHLVSGFGINTIVNSSISSGSISLDKGVYKIHWPISVVSTRVRYNFLQQIEVNGGTVLSLYGSAYTRAASGHNESSSTISGIIELLNPSLVSFFTENISGTLSGTIMSVSGNGFSIGMVERIQ